MSFEDLKGILAKFLNPDLEEDESEDTDVEETTVSKGDLPWEQDEEEETPAPKKNYALQSKPKTTKADKFDALFEDEDEN